MSIIDFKRLGPDAVSSIRRVYEKIQRLGNESFTKRAEGIRAWRDSEIYRVYVDIGNEGLAKGKSVNDVIQSRQQQGLPTLTLEEFSLIADLHKKLRT
jgi:hypothetical protein